MQDDEISENSSDHNIYSKVFLKYTPKIKEKIRTKKSQQISPSEHMRKRRNHNFRQKEEVRKLAINGLAKLLGNLNKKAGIFGY